MLPTLPIDPQQWKSHYNEEEPVELFTHVEVKTSLKKCPIGKSPGIDGVKYEHI